MLKKDKEKELNYTKLNEGIRIGVDILKIFLILAIVSLVFISSKLLIDWKILPFISTLLKTLLPLFIGIIIAWLFDPLVTRLQKKGVSRVLGSIFVYLILILFIYLLSRLIVPSVANQLEDLGKSVPNFVNYLKDNIDSFFNTIGKGSDFDYESIRDSLYGGINNISNSLTVDLPSKVVSIASTIFAGGVNLLIGLLVGLYMLFDFDSVKKHIHSLVPKKYKKDTFELMGQLNSNLKSYVQGTLLIMAVLFVIQSLSLAAAGLKAPMVFGLFCALTDIIPYIGPYIGGIPAVLVGLSMSPTTGIFVLIAILISQSIENYFLQPVVMGKTMKLHPVTIMVGLLVFNRFFGIPGMVLATPTIAIFKTIFNFFNDKYRFIDKIKDH